jgi:phosphoribosylanthranilate isomerase
MPEVKICGLTRAADAAAAERAGATYGGVIFAPESPRRLDESRAAEVFADSGLVRCGVFVNESEARIAAAVDRIGLGVVQLHGEEIPEFAAIVRSTMGVEVWKALRIRNADDFEEGASRYEGSVDGLLLDGWSEQGRGGTGSRFPWQEVAERRRRLGFGTKLIAAGGLRPENVGELVELLDPEVVDVSSGVETAPGLKGEELIMRFVAAAKSAVARKGV